LNETAAAHPDKRIQLWFQDEARFGQQGTVCRVWAECGSRPRRVKQTGYRWLYLFGAVCPENGRAHGCLFPWANTEVMNRYLEDFAKNLEPEVHALYPFKLVLTDSSISRHSRGGGNPAVFVKPWIPDRHLRG